MDISAEDVKEVLARQAIEEVLAKYCFAVGRHDWDGVRQCFVPGAEADYGFEAPQTIEAQVELLARGMARFPASTLLSATPVITFTGDGALSETMALTAHEGRPGTSEPVRISVVRYDDTWTQQEHRWLINRRRLTTCWRGWLDSRHDDRAGDHRYASEWK